MRQRILLILLTIVVGGLGLPARAASPEADRAMKILHKSEDLGERLQAVRRLGELRERRTVKALVDALQPLTGDPRDDWYVREACVLALIRIGEPSVGPLSDALEDPVPAVRIACLKALVILEAPGVLDRLTERLLSDPSAEVRSYCVGALRRLRDPRAIGALAKAARDDEDPRVRERAEDTVHWLER